ncbi:MAG TPA: hypothetical protein VHH88_06385 [Verrucomicrobiae bacterium]|nr:hypothetical protein [Verrucomicrobiae bacterium]
MNSRPMVRIDLIHTSLRVFSRGLLSCIPLVGIVPAVLALRDWSRARRTPEWNPAAAYLAWGARLAILTLTISGLSFVLVAIFLILNLI